VLLLLLLLSFLSATIGMLAIERAATFQATREARRVREMGSCGQLAANGENAPELSSQMSFRIRSLSVWRRNLSAWGRGDEVAPGGPAG
jgi:hypothetical protein